MRFRSRPLALVALVSVLFTLPPTIAFGGPASIPFGPWPVPSSITAIQEQLAVFAETVRQAKASRKVYQEQLWKSLDPKVNQILAGDLLTAPEFDPTLCRYSLGANPFLKNGDSEPVEQESDAPTADRSPADYESVERLHEEQVPEEMRPSDLSVQDTENINPRFLESPPAVVAEALCPLQQAADLDQQALQTAFEDINAGLITVLKDDYELNYVASATIAALTILYLDGDLTSTKNGCVMDNLVETASLIPQVSGGKNPGSITTVVDTSKLVKKLSCLTDDNLFRLTTALAKAMKLAISVVDFTSPDISEAVQKDIFTDYGPLLITLYDRTKQEGPTNPFYAMLHVYKSVVEKAPALTNYGATKAQPKAITLYNPQSKAMENVPICDGEQIEEYHEELINKLTPKPPAGDWTLDSLMQERLEIYYDPVLTAKEGPRTLYGASIPAMNFLSTGPDPVWLSAKKVWDIMNDCLYFPNFMIDLLHPVHLGDGSCAAWDSARLGLKCPQYKMPQIKWSENGAQKGLQEAFGAWFIPTAHAGPPASKGWCLVEVEKPDGSSEWQKFDIESSECTTSPCTCDPEKVKTCSGSYIGCAKVELCGSCATGGGNAPPMSCKDSCAILKCAKFSDGKPKTLMNGKKVYTAPVINLQNGKEICKAGTLVAKCKPFLIDPADPTGLAKACKACQETCDKGGGYCGDGKVAGSESCDDGNIYNVVDGCNVTCEKVPACVLQCATADTDDAKLFVAMKKMADEKTVQLQTGINNQTFIYQPSCTIPFDINDPNGKTLFKKGNPCDTPAFVAYYKQVVGNLIKCESACVQKSMQEKLAECKSLIPECKINDDLLAKINANGNCTLDQALTDSAGNVLCSKGESCTCKLKFSAFACKQGYDECVSKIAGEDKQGLNCKQWEDISGTDAQWFTEKMEIFNQLDPKTASIPYDIQMKLDMIKDFKEGGAKKFAEILPYVVSWLQYMIGEELPKEFVESAKYMALELLKDSGWCGDLPKSTGSNNWLAEYHPDLANNKICWSHNISKYAPNDVSNLAAHETIHAFTDWVLKAKGIGKYENTMTPSGILPPGMPEIKLADFLVSQPAIMDHWIMQVMDNTVPGFSKTDPLAWGGQTKDELCGF